MSAPKRMAPTPVSAEEFAKIKKKGNLVKQKRKKRVNQTEGVRTEEVMMRNSRVLGPALKKFEAREARKINKSPRKDKVRKDNVIALDYKIGQAGRRFILNGAGHKCYIDKRK